MKKVDQRTMLTKTMIKNSFIKLLNDKPLQNITVKELCDIAEINRGTFYKYYLDVYDLKDKLEDEFTEKLITALLPLANADNNSASLTHVLSTVFEVIHANSDFSSLLISQNTDKRFVSKLLAIGYENYINSYVKLFPDVDKMKLNYYYSFISAGCIGVLESWLTGGMRERIEEVVAITDKIIISGVGILYD